MNYITVHYLNIMDQDQFNVLRKINQDPKSTQRDLSKILGLSLGKINYCLKELKIKGLVKIKNFQKHSNKIQYVYVLTPKGLTEKTKLTINFMKRKMKEYDELKKELDKK
jgi:EPS-associated MarR family transcriptional regulator